MSELTVALLQLAPLGIDWEANVRKGEEGCRRAKAMGAHIALFPEMWSIGYTSPDGQTEGAPEPQHAEPWHDDVWRNPMFWRQDEESPDSPLQDAIKRWHALAVGRDSAFVQHFQRLARELDMAIALTYLEAWPGAPRNSVSLIDRHGDIVFTYAKVHLCDFSAMEGSLTPGDRFCVGQLDIGATSVQVGAMICYDREFPESARVLMLQGAELILVPNACGIEQIRLRQLQTRAYENMVAVAMTNYPAPHLENNGHSAAFHPVAFANGGARDTLVVEAGERESIYLAHFDLDEIRDYRRRETWGNAFRRPHTYGAITSSEVAEPFVRVNVQGERWDSTRRQAQPEIVGDE